MSTLGIVTIGQAPRDDIVELFAAQAPAGTKVILRGALDGLSDAEVDALPPLSGADTLYTRLRGGRDVKISKQAVIARSPGTLAMPLTRSVAGGVTIFGSVRRSAVAATQPRLTST